MSAETLLPLLVLLPLGAASALLILAHVLPSWASDAVSVLVSLAVAAAAASIASASAASGAPVEHWFGAWGPGAHGSGRLILGIAFRADPVSAGAAAFVSLMFAASFVFAWGYFERIHSHFQILMLLFLAGMVGFCVTGDLFNLFVWFELMSVSAFALTAYPLGQSALDGAFNFVVTNALAGFMMLAACGLVYARCGTLDMVAIGQIARGLGRDPVLAAALALLTAGLLTKAAMIPFHFWLADAHAVAPSPVSVIFSGAMVPVALFGHAKLMLVAFSPDRTLVDALSPLLVAGGCATAVIAGLTAWSQRHLKRLLAFSTISHLGVMLAGVATLSAAGSSGFALYLVGHGLVKGALFMVAGILLALCASPDEIVLYGRGRRYWPAGIVMGLAGLMLAGLPLGQLHAGTALIHRAVGAPAAVWAIAAGEALTGAAVLRAALRIFAGCSGQPGVELLGPTERERERANRPFALMLAPAALLVAASLLPAEGWPERAAAGFRIMTGRAAAGAPPPPEPGPPWIALSTVGVALLVVGVALLRRRPVRPLARAAFRAEKAPFRALEFLHSGLIGDYAAWVAVGLATLAAWIGR